MARRWVLNKVKFRRNSRRLRNLPGASDSQGAVVVLYQQTSSSHARHPMTGPARHAHSARPRSAGGTPFGFEPAAAPAAPDQFDYDRGFRPRRRTSWDKVRSGIFFLYFSTLCFFLYAALSFALITHDITLTSETTAKLVLVLLVLLSLGGVVLAAIGEGFCCGVPYDSGAKGAVTGSTVFMILTTIAVAVLSVFDLKNIFSPSIPDRSTAELIGILMLVKWGTLLAAVILFFFFLTLAAVHLRLWLLVKSIMGYCVVMPLTPLALLLIIYFGVTAERASLAGRGGGLDPGLLKALVYGTIVLGALWFALLLAGLSSGAGRASRRAG